VDKEGAVLERGIREAVRRSLVTEEKCFHWCGLMLRKRDNWDGDGDVYDLYGEYGEKEAVYGRIMDGVAMPVEEGLSLFG